jgi:hypothetical protein
MLIYSNFTPVGFPEEFKYYYHINEHAALSKYFTMIYNEIKKHPLISCPEYLTIFYALPSVKNKNEFILYCLEYNTNTYSLEYIIDIKPHKKIEDIMHTTKFIISTTNERYKRILCPCKSCIVNIFELLEIR